MPGGQTLARVQLFLDFVTDWFRRQTRNQKAAQAQADARSAGELAPRPA